MKLSIVTTLYKSAPHLEGFYKRIVASVEKITNDYEIIFVNDCSPDGSLGIAVALFNNNKNIKIIDLSRNFGQHKAIMTGLSYATGDMIFLIDSDLEEPPEILKTFYSRFVETKDCDVTFGVLEARKGSYFIRLFSNLFYKLMSFVSDVKAPENIAFTRLMSRRYVNSLLKFKERELYLGGLFFITGYKQLPVLIKSSYKGQTAYSLKKRMALAINAITSFSNKPLIFMFNFGLLILLLTGIYILYTLFRWLFYSIPIVGWTSLIISIWLLGGLMICFVGIIGIYLSKIFVETKNRPLTIIKDIYDNSPK